MSDGERPGPEPQRRVTAPITVPTVEDALDRACDVLRKAQRILLTSHRRPDGDGTGSMCGLKSLLSAIGKEAVIYSMDPIARRYKWLPLADTVVHTIAFDDRYDCTIIVDCADIALLGDALPPPEVCGPVITLDHHASGHPFGDIAVSDPTAAAVGVLVWRIAQREGWELTRQAAIPLYVSLISDTGGYRHANTNAEALLCGSELIRAGVVPSSIAASLEERPSPGKLRLLGSVLSTLELQCAGRVGVLSVTTDMVEGARASWEDIEGMVNWARNVDGVHVGVLLTTAKGGGVRVSMRSRSEKIDVGKVCMSLGGGGHPGAGGCHMAGDLTTTKEKIVRALEAAFNRQSRPVLDPTPAASGSGNPGSGNAGR
ncbi:MAG: DHH family phosphoesterase [Deltaproteobacteria bacterium]|nr:DHH family phosphoesterase [Deltaproteobacteria bacterium]MDQ3298650.1 DHH family phosphoesterase [Myxococcota bacterium]